MICYYISSRWHPLFEIFTQSIDAIDVTSVTLSRLNSINAIDVTRVTRDCRMANVHWSIGSQVHQSNGPLVLWFIGPLVHWLNVKCQMSIRFNFCWSVHPELLRSFFSSSAISRFPLKLFQICSIVLSSFMKHTTRAVGKSLTGPQFYVLF